MVKILFKIENGEQEFLVDGILGATLMEIAVLNNVPGIDASCGGACSCATCHIFIAPEFINKIPAADDLEESMLYVADDPRENSRLACQIVITQELDGLLVYIPATSI